MKKLIEAASASLGKTVTIKPRQLIAASTWMSTLLGVRFLNELHPSLGNVDKVRYLLAKFQAQKSPHGTNLVGAVYELQRNKELGAYLREVNVLPSGKILLTCMTRRQAELLGAVQGLEIDMSYKRISGDIHEVEFNHYHPGSAQTLTLARIFTNAAEDADTYQRIFKNVDSAVLGHKSGKAVADKSGLRWKHIEGESGNLAYVKADWAPGQAKGFGLYLHTLDSTRTWPEHLTYVYVGCLVHYHRNVNKQKVDDEVRLLMRSLPTLEVKEDVNATFDAILGRGGEDLKEWVDFYRAEWTRAALTPAYSNVPTDILKSIERNTNASEAAHANINRDGKALSLLEGIIR